MKTNKWLWATNLWLMKIKEYLDQEVDNNQEVKENLLAKWDTLKDNKIICKALKIKIRWNLWVDWKMLLQTKII